MQSDRLFDVLVECQLFRRGQVIHLKRYLVMVTGGIAADYLENSLSLQLVQVIRLLIYQLLQLARLFRCQQGNCAQFDGSQGCLHGRLMILDKFLLCRFSHLVELLQRGNCLLYFCCYFLAS